MFEAELEPTSHGYRPGRGVRTAIAAVRELRDRGYRWAVDADVDDYFSSVPHDRLFERLRRLRLDPYFEELFGRWVRAEVWDGRRLWTLERGLPQGAVVSPVLANLLLDGVDELLAALGCRAVRYADDFLVLCKGPRQAAEALELTDAVLEALELDLNRAKTALVDFERGFTFLGALFVGDAVFRRLDRAAPERPPLTLPPALDLRTYLEQRAAAVEGALEPLRALDRPSERPPGPVTG